jgi:hypothetical protein
VIYLDTSVVVALLTREERSTQALEWLEQCRETDMDPWNRSRVNESPHPARLGWGLDHETHQAHRCWEYNSLRPHSAFQGRTPLEAAHQEAAA